jgi:autotransporter-associated beta strand protein
VVNTINMGAFNITMSGASPVLQANGLLASGGTNVTLGGGTTPRLQPTSSGGEIVIRVAGSSDQLTVNSIIQNNTTASPLTKTGAGTLVLNGTNTYTGKTYVNEGTLTISNVANLGASPTTGGTVTVLTSATNSKTVTISSVPAGFVVGSTLLGSDVISIVGTTVTLYNNASETITSGSPSRPFFDNNNTLNFDGATLRTTASVGLFSGNTAAGTNNRSIVFRNGVTFNTDANTVLTVAGGITGSGGLTKSGLGTLTLTNGGTSSYNFTGGITVNGGTLSLSPTNYTLINAKTNIVNTANAVSLNNATLEWGGIKNNESIDQTLNGVTISGPTLFNGTNNAAANGAGQILKLNFITRNAGATASFTIASTASVFTTTANTNGILGPWATINTGSSTRYATGATTTGTSAQIAGYTTGVTAADATAFASATTNYEFTTGSTTTLTGPSTAYTARYSGAGNTIDLGSSGSNTLTLNGLLNAGTGTLTIQRSGTSTGTVVIGATNELIVNAASAAVAIAAPIVNGGAAGTLIKTATGTLALSSANTYSGGTFVHGGNLLVRNDSALGTGALTLNGSSSLNLTNGAVSTLSVGGTLNIGGGGGTKNLLFDLGAAAAGTDKIAVSGAFSMETSGAGVININQLGGVATRADANATGYDIITAASGLSAADFRLATTKAFGQTFGLTSPNPQTLRLTTAQVGTDVGNTTLSAANSSWATAANFSPSGLPDYTSNVTISNNNMGTTSLNGSTDINSLTFTTSMTAGSTISAGTATAGTPASMLVIEAAGVNGNTAGNGITLNNNSGTHTISANVGIARNQTWSVASAGTLAVSGNITDFGGGYGITKSGGGTLQLTGTNTFFGGLTLSGGTVIVTSDANLGAASGPITVTSNSTLLLGVSAAATINSSRQINLNGGTATFTNVTPISGSSFSTSGKVTGAGSILVSAGTNTPVFTLSLNSLSNDFTGAVTIDATGNGGSNTITVNAASLADATGSGNIRFGRNQGSVTQQFTYTGTSDLTLDNRKIEFLATTGTASRAGLSSTSAAIIVNTDLVVAAGGGTTLILGAEATVPSRFNGILKDGSLATLITKTGSGTWVLSGANTYTGVTTVSGGTLSISSIDVVANANPLGRSTAAAANLLLGNGTTLRYTGGAASTDRSFTINGAASGDSATLDASGTGAVNFTSTSTPNYGAGNQTRTLILGGSNTDANTLAANIANNTLAVSLTKNGVGKWVLTGNNIYAGTNTINLGTLVGTQTTGNPFGTGAVTLGAGTLSLAPTGGSNVTVTGGTVAAATKFTFNAGATLSLNKGSQTSLTYTFGGTGATWTRGTTAGNTGTLILSVGAIANLGAAAGSGERFLINGTAPTTVGTALLVDGVVAQDRGNSNAGDFVTYGGTNGFAAATPTLLNTFTGSVNTSYVNVTSLTSTGTIAAHAVKVSGTTLTNSGTLTLGNGANTAGLILNSGIVSGGTLTTPAAAAEFVIYTSGTSEISSVIPTATNMTGMSVFGPGTLALTSGSANGFTGGLRINNTTVIATNDNQLGGTTSSITLTGGTLQTSGPFGLGQATGQRSIILAAGQNQTGGTFNVTADTTTFTSTTSKVISGSGSLTKTGAGILALATTVTPTTNSYTGGTFVNEGTLRLDASAMLADTGAVTVGGGTFDIQTFSDTVGAVTLTSGSINGSGGTLTGTSYAVQGGTVSANLAGTVATMTKTTSGTVSLSGTNTYTGNTLVSVGTLQFAKQVSLYNNGGAAPWSKTNINVNSGATMAFNMGGSGEFTKTDILNLLLLADATTNGFKTGAILGLDTTSGDVLFNSVIANPNAGNNVLGLTKLGTNKLTLDQANTYTGVTTVSAGTLALNGTGVNTTILTDGNTATTSDILISGGTLELAASEQIANTGSINMTSGAFNFGAATGKTETIDKFTNSGGTFTTGANILIGLGNTVTWSGTSTNTVSDGGLVKDGHIVISDSTSTNTVQGGATGGVLELLSTAPALLEMSNGATLTLNADAVFAGKLLLSGNISTIGDATVTIASAGVGNPGNIDLNNGTRTFTVANGTAATDMSISARITNGSIIKDGAGTLSLDAENTYSGTTAINGGTLIANALGALPLSPRSAVSFTGGGNPTLSLGASQVAASLNSVGGGTTGTVTLGSNTLTVGAGSGNTDFKGSIGGAGNLIKDDASTQVLSGTNAYTGTTTVSGGTLEVQGSLSGTTAVTVNTSGTLLLNSAASPIINTAATMTVGGGTVKIDNSLNNTNQTFGSLTLTGTSILDFGTGSNGNTMTFSSLSFTGTKLNVYNWTGSAYGAGVADTGTFADTQDRLLFNADTIYSGTEDNRIEFFSDSGITSLGFGQEVAFGSQFELVPITAVPEPATTALIGSIALCALIGYRERRRFTGLGKRIAARK